MRTRRLAVALCGIAITLLIGLPVAGLPAAHAAPEQVYLALGDSIAAGLVTSLPSVRGYPWIVRDLIQKSNTAAGSPATVTLDNLAVPGETTTSFLNGSQLKQAQSDIASIKAQGGVLRAVTLTLGGNDLLNLRGASQSAKQAGLTQFKTNYPAALGAIKSALGDLKPDIVVTTYYDLSEGDPNQQGSDAWWVAQFNQVIRQTAAADGAKVVDLETAFRGHISQWTWYPADVHPNNAGQAEIAKLVWQALGYDQRPPAVTIERPSPGKQDRRVLTVRVKASDDIGVTSVQLLVDGTADGDLLYIPSQGAYIGVWDGRSATSTTATLSVRASDLAGHQTTATVSVTLPAK
ncbi:MAG TPA: GDSL-type esterase/lipase family protein [Thermomicrobiaceae bacterium]|nr:GDSL-type esterase/lipase family protein [Thermomicrobiaceae bacterium]